MTERERLTECGVAVDVTTEEFAAATPAVPADRIECPECGSEYIGDKATGTVCPSCA